MQQKRKKCLAAVLSAVLVASMLMNTFAVSVFAQDDRDALAEQIVAELQQEESEQGQPQVSETPSATPEATELPEAVATPEPTQAPSPEESQAPAETPEPTGTPVPTATPEVTATPAPTASPAPSATPVPTVSPEPTESPEPTAVPELSLEEQKDQIRELLEKSTSMAMMSEEELEEALEEIDAIASAPMAMTAGEQDDELLDLLDQLENARVAMEDMRTAWQAKREGWLDQLPQTGKENSWRYQNGERLESDVPEALMDLPDGVSTFSVKGYWGIDVSHHQGVIDWEAVKAAGVDFAIIRCGFGMDLPEQDDKQWSRNASECERLGIPYGVYFYSYAVTAEMAVEEGAHAVRLLQGYDPDLPVFYDMEENRQLVVGNSGLAEIARIFCDIVSSKGYEVGVYASLNWWEYYLTDAVFENWYRWVAEWRPSCSYNGRYEMWQYTSEGSVNGISGNVDMNYWYGDLPGNDGLNGLHFDQTAKKWYYYKNGKIDKTYTGVTLNSANGNWYYVKNGELDWNYTGLAPRVENGNYYYVKNGMLDWKYTGMASYGNKQGYVSGGVHQKTLNGLNQLNGTWYKMSNGWVDSGYTGVVQRPANGNWYYIKNGVLDWNYTGLAPRVENGNYYYVKKGMLDWGYTGMADYGDQQGYVKGGSLQKSLNGLNQLNGTWYKMNNGWVDSGYTGVVQRPANGNWYYVKNGVLDWNCTGLARRVENGNYYYVKNGMLDWGYTGMADYGDQQGYVKGGLLQKSLNGLNQLEGTWYKMSNGWVDSGYTGVVQRPANGNWYYIKNGVLDWNYTGLAPRVENGNYYYVKSGMLDWTFNGQVEYNGQIHLVKNGRSIQIVG